MYKFVKEQLLTVFYIVFGKFALRLGGTADVNELHWKCGLFDGRIVYLKKFSMSPH